MFGPWTSFGAAQFLQEIDDQYLQLPKISFVSSKFSVCTWYFTTTSASSAARIFSFGQQAGLISIVVAFESKELVFRYYSGGVLNAQSRTPSAYNEWRHMCLVMADQNGTIYSDGLAHGFGLLKAQESGSTFDSNYIGKPNQTNEFVFEGKISDFRIFNDALTPEEVLSIYNYRGDGLSPVLAIPCSAGSFSAADSSVCTQCPGGKYSIGTRATSEDSCQLCEAGKFSNQSASFCTYCSPGSFSDSAASIICRVCEPGKYSNQSYLQSCQSCEVGKYSNQTGSSVCTNCPPGIYLNSSSNPPSNFTLATSEETCQVRTAGIMASNQSAGGVLPVSVMCGTLFPSSCSSAGGVTVYINVSGTTSENGMLGPVLIGNYSVSTKIIAGWLSFICPPLAMLGQQVTKSSQILRPA